MCIDLVGALLLIRNVYREAIENFIWTYCGGRVAPRPSGREIGFAVAVRFRARVLFTHTKRYGRILWYTLVRFGIPAHCLV